MSGSATAAAQSTTSMLTRNTAPKPAPLATKPSAELPVAYGTSVDRVLTSSV